jgi:hypothetical protein
VLRFVETQGRPTLSKQLKAGYRANVERDLSIAAEWFRWRKKRGAATPYPVEVG